MNIQAKFGAHYQYNLGVSQPLPTVQVSQLAQAMKAEGQDVILIGTNPDQYRLPLDIPIYTRPAYKASGMFKELPSGYHNPHILTAEDAKTFQQDFAIHARHGAGDAYIQGTLAKSHTEIDISKPERTPLGR